MNDDERVYLERLTFCIDANFPAPVTAALLTLADDECGIGEAHEVWEAHDYERYFAHSIPVAWRGRFADAVESVVGGSAPVRCSDCRDWEWADDTNTVYDAREVCDSCLDQHYSSCSECGRDHRDENITHVAGNALCDIACLERYCTYCDYCEEWWRDQDGHPDHDDDNDDDDGDSCGCEAPLQRFEFPANGDGTVANDERITVTLPAGTIDDSGLRAIRDLLFAMVDEHGNSLIAGYHVNEALHAVGDQWLGQRGNFTRRLSRELYASYKVKIPAGVLTEVGNLARQHSSDVSTWNVEFTRDLNQSASDFYHEDSCWWGSHSGSRCALKNWGGLGLRVFSDDGYVDGRAWVQPLTDDKAATHDTVGAHAYLVFNCYGELSGAKAARIVAHLTGRTYRRIGYCSDSQYVNNDIAWLVADEATALSTNDLSFHYSSHDTLDALDITTNQEAAA